MQVNKIAKLIKYFYTKIKYYNNCIKRRFRPGPFYQ